MKTEQLCLFEFGKPLLDCLGKDFFKTLPRSPGVYVFRDAQRRVLYVGQSKNLRARLGYYKNALPEREPRKIIRLVHQARAVELEPCETQAQARLREIQLIREYRPRFNTAHALSRTYTYFYVAAGEQGITLKMTMNEPASESGWFGAYRSHGLCRRAFRAIGRTLWADLQPVASVYDFPLWLHDHSRRIEQVLPTKQASHARELAALLHASSSEFLARAGALMEKAADPFVRKVHEADFQTLTEFAAIAEKTKVLREFSGSEGLISQATVDELTLRMRLQREEFIAQSVSS